MSRYDRKRANYLFRRIENDGVCVYCGDRANTLDHFYPLSMAARLYDLGLRATKGKVLLPACVECNSIAGHRLFRTVGAKRRFVQQRLREKYARIIRIPRWDDDDLEELGCLLQTHVRGGLNRKEWILARINHRNGGNAHLSAVTLRLADHAP